MTLNKRMFIRPKNELEGEARLHQTTTDPGEVFVSCSSCKSRLFTGELQENLNVCPQCGLHLKLSARQRIALISDEDSFDELDAGLTPRNFLEFPGYDKKLDEAHENSGEKESVVTGWCSIDGHACAIFAMEPDFMMGSMGSITGEKLTRLFEAAARKRLPVVGFTVSGGARVQEGILSLMQMAKVSASVAAHSDAGLLYICVLQHPTTGGVTASFAMEADIILAEPNALIGFAGPRVIQQTMRQELPEGFQRAEFLQDKGFVDRIVARADQKRVLSTLLAMHEGGMQHGRL